MRQTQISRRGLDRTSVTVLALALAAGSVAAQPGATPTGDAAREHHSGEHAAGRSTDALEGW